MKGIIFKAHLILLAILAANNAAFSAATEPAEPFSNDNPLSLNTAARAGLGAAHIINIQELVASEHVAEVNDVIWYRWFFRKSANWNEMIGNTAGYLAMAATPAAAATTLISASATPYVIFAGSTAAVVKIFCMGLASCSTREAAERQDTLNNLTTVINVRPVNIVPTVTNPENESRV